MSIPVNPGRMDLLLLALAETACKRYVDPALPIPVWSESVAREVASRIARAGIPSQPIQHVQIGQLRLPMGVVHWTLQAFGVLPKQIGGGE